VESRLETTRNQSVLIGLISTMMELLLYFVNQFVIRTLDLARELNPIWQLVLN